MAPVKSPKEVKSSKEGKMAKEVVQPIQNPTSNFQTPIEPVSQKGSPVASAVIMSGILISFSIFLHAYILKGVTLPGLKGNTGKTEQTQINDATVPTGTGAGTVPEGTKVDVSVDDDPVKGDKNAKVTLVEFSDFQCPFCERFYSEAYKSIVKDYVDTGKVKIVFRDYPLSFHPNAQISAEAAECADEQGKFWEFHDLLFTKQNDWANLTNDQAKGKFGEYAGTVGLNVSNFNSCVNSGKYTEEVKKDEADGNKYGVTGTPTIFINGMKLVGAQPYSEFKQVIDNELSK